MTLSITRKLTLLFIALVTLTAQIQANESLTQPVSFTDVVAEVEAIMQQHHYNPAELQSKEYQTTVQLMRTLASEADSKSSFVFGFNEIWQEGPFSHVNMVSREGTAEQMAIYLDNMNVGDSGAILSWEKGIAILTINTMMGVDTISRIKQAYRQIAESDAKAIIIDLRNNEGGAFAIRPLVSHLIRRPLESGYFLSRHWTAKFNRQPDSSELAALSAWSGWSIRAFWRDVQNTPVIKVKFEPQDPHLNLPVYVLTSNKTASASELAVDALSSAHRVTIIGQPTAGKMLSQKPFDLPNGLQLFIPIADYYSLATGRIEGKPIVPDVTVNADDALRVAINRAINSDK